MRINIIRMKWKGDQRESPENQSQALVGVSYVGLKSGELAGSTQMDFEE